MPGGVLFRFPTLQLRPSAGEILRAFLESIGFAVRANLDQIEAVTGRPSSALIAGGGMTRSDLLVQILADASRLPVRRVREAECTGLGCAMLIAAGAGVHPDLDAAVAAMCGHTIVAPDAERCARIVPAFAKWRELYETLGMQSV
jgi:sugar (pentulose or hexulose) kinase